MSELFDKQVNAQKEKNFQLGFTQAHEKSACAMKMKENRRIRKNDVHVKMFLMGGERL